MARDRIKLPNLETSLNKVLRASAAIQKVVPHHDTEAGGYLYTTVDELVEPLAAQGDVELDAAEKTGLYQGLSESFEKLLHVEQNDGRTFNKETLRYKSTMTERTNYVEALLITAQRATISEPGALSTKDIRDYRRAKDLILQACKADGRKRVSRTGPQVGGKLQQAYDLIMPIVQKAAAYKPAG